MGRAKRAAGGTPPAAHNKLDLEGAEFGRLVAEGDSGERYADPRGKAGAVLWLCHCAPRLGGCGARVLVATHNLRSGNTTSCGCYHVDISVAKRGGRRSRPLARAVRIDGEALLARRLEAGMAQEPTADAVGVSRPCLHYWESGENRHMHPRTAARLAAVLGCSVGDFTDDTVLPGRARPGSTEEGG